MKDVFTIFSNFFVLLFLFTNVDADDNCYTPDGVPGECVLINSCRSLYDLLRRKPLRNQDREFLRSSKCSTGQATVCCPSPQLPVPGLSECGKTFLQFPNRIFGGTDTKIGEFPWMAVLLYEKTNGQLNFGCGGALITEKHVLTAAHCVQKEQIPKSWNLKYARLGEWDRTVNPDCQDIFETFYCANDPVDYGIESSFLHELYNSLNPNKVNDIAVLVLETSVVYTEFIRPICIQDYIAADDERPVTVIGFGKTETLKSSDRLQSVEIDIENHEVCTRKYRLQGRSIEKSQICAFKRDADTCNGDSGSPLMRQSTTSPPFWYLVGITSFGPADCGRTDYPGVYTNVNDFVTWIKEKIKS